MRQINLNGPEGNAFYLLGQAKKFARELGYTQEEIDNLTDRMKAGDYSQLVDVFEQEFKAICTVKRDAEDDHE